MKTKNIFPTILCVISVFSGITGCSQAENSLTPTINPQVGTSTPEPPPSMVVEGEVVIGDFVNLSFKNPGVVDEVSIVEGEAVSDGQVIARLKGREQVEAQIAAIDLRLLTAQQDLDDYLDNAAQNMAEAKLALAQAQKVYKDAVEDHENLSKTKGSIDRIELAYAQYILAQNKVDEAERAYAGVQNLAEDDEDRAEIMATLTTARENRDAALATWNYIKSKPDDFEAAEITGQFDVAEADLEDARRNLDELEDGVDPDELAVKQGRVTELEIQSEALHQKLDDLLIVAPIDGFVVINDLEIGELVAAGTSYVTVANDTSWNIETTDMTELEVVGIEKGMPVLVTFDALPDVELSGKVERVKEIGVSKQGDVTYTVVIKLDEWDNRLLWKMTASVTINR